MQRTIEKSGSFVTSQFRETHPRGGSTLVGPAVTIVHQTGSGAYEVANRLAEILQESEPKGAQPWTVLARQVVETALREHHWPSEMASRITEDKRSYLDDILDDLFGLRPPSWVLVPQEVETIVHLAQMGHVILIGRGATVVTAQIPNVFHVRLVASMETRIARVQKSHKLTAREAAHFIKKEDRGRERYVEANLHAHLDDDLLYHMVVNTDRISCDEAARVIAYAARRSFGDTSVGEP
jgi:hypothetical protein